MEENNINEEAAENVEEIFEERADFQVVREKIDRIKEEISQVIVGQEDMIDLILVALLSDGHILIEGNPGLAKTLTARLLSRVVSSEFNRIQFTPDLMPSDVLGTSIFNFNSSQFEFKRGPIFSNIILIDEINRAPAKTQAALFEVMEERQVTVDGKTYPMTPPFMIVATQNPIDMEGTYRLPEAQMDRFLFKISVDYPTVVEEIKIIKRHGQGNSNNKHEIINPVITGQELIELHSMISEVKVEDKIVDFIATIVNATRSHHDIILGGSPRASLALYDGSRALAILNGRDFVIPDDVIQLAIPVLGHRIIISPEREMEGVKEGTIINGIVKGIEVPR